MADDALARLCHRLALDEAPARAALAVTGRGGLPWYLLVVMAIGAWLAMITIVGLAAQLVIAFAVDDEATPLLLAGFGVATAAASVAIRRGGEGSFAHQFALATALAGQAMVAGGLGAEWESLWLAAGAAALVAAALLAFFKDPIHQFLAAAMALVLAGLALVLDEVPQAAGLLAIAALPPALLLLTRPPAAPDLRGLAYALLLVPMAALSIPVGSWLGVDAHGAGSLVIDWLGIDWLGADWLWADWLARAAHAAGLVTVLALLWRSAAPERRPLVAAAGAAAILLGAVTAAGLLASLLLLALAYLLGSRMLAALGVAAHIWFLSRYYHDLQLDLLVKSGMLVAAGAVLLALWWAWSRGAWEAAGDG